MNYEAGYKATYYAYIIDPKSWRDQIRLDVISGSIKRQSKGLRQSADIEVTDFDQSKEFWIRVYMDARQNENISHEALFTGLVSAPQKDISGAIVKRTLDCYSVLKPCEDRVLERGWYAGKGENGAIVIKRLLTTDAPVVVNGDAPSLDNYIVAEDGETNLSMIDKVLDSIDWRMIIRGDGTIELGAKPTKPNLTFGARQMDVLKTTLTVERDWFGCPNVFRASSGDAVAEARDEDANSPLSIISRGREIIRQEDNVSLSNDEGIAEYAARRLKEEQTVAESAHYDRCYVPDINIGDVVAYDYDELQGIYAIDEQTIQLTHGGMTSEVISHSAKAEAEE